jgi:hypothetical protein
VKRLVRAEVEHRLDVLYGLGPHIAWDLRRAVIAVQGHGLRRQLVTEGVPAENIVVTGNPVLDDLHRLRSAPEVARRRITSQLGLSADDRIVTLMRTHEERLLSLDRPSREQAQVDVVQALRRAAPDARVVVKIHPREGEAEKAFVRSIDPDLVVVGEEVATNELLTASDVVVSTTSFTLVHSVVLDRPTVSAWFWPGLEYFRRITDWPAVERVDSPDALTEAVRRHLDDPAHRAAWKAKRDAFVEEQFLVDGQGTTRVVDLLEHLTRNDSEAGVATRP